MRGEVHPALEAGKPVSGPQAPVLEQACRGQRRMLSGSRREASGNRTAVQPLWSPSPDATSTPASTPGHGVNTEQGTRADSSRTQGPPLPAGRLLTP